MSTEGSGASRSGRSLENEDHFLVEEGLGLYVVCDGDSGRPAGEVASEVAVRALEQFIETADDTLATDIWRGSTATSVVERALRYAVNQIVATAEASPELEGMATTITVLLAHGKRGIIGHRGDSRAYLLRGRRCHQLTVDHELTESISNGTSDADLPIDVFAIDLNPRDTVVLCSDGAEEAVKDPSIVYAASELSPRLLASRIVGLGNRMNPSADTTAVVVRIRGEREPGWLELSSEPRGVSFGHTIPATT